MQRFRLGRLFSRADAGQKPFKERRKRKRFTPREGSTILVVDDSKVVRQILRKMLTQGGYRVIEAETAETGLELADQQHPDLIFMDVVLPGMNGFRATRQLRMLPSTKDIPIVVMSGSEQATEQFWVIKIGASDFLAKPFSRGNVFKQVEALLYHEATA